MKYGIVVDSGCDLRLLEGDDENLIYRQAPLSLRLDESEWVDDNGLDTKIFMREMAKCTRSGSAAPGPEDWCRFYMEAEEIFAITITGTLSGSYNSAAAARQMVMDKYPNKKIFLLDSKSTGPEMTLLVYKIRECVRKGMTFEEITEEITMYHRKTRLLFVLESLDNLVKNGRVSKIRGIMAGVLGIRILGRASEEGTLEILKKCRGKQGAYDKLVQQMAEDGYQGTKVVISHCFQEEMAQYLCDLLRKRFPACQTEIMPTSGLCSYYAEQGGILVGYDICSGE
ncbi:MAG: DegV family protein [Eubacteriales bacterium]|nr:DegV family protein [Eubacteriales bacterium]